MGRWIGLAVALTMLATSSVATGATVNGLTVARLTTWPPAAPPNLQARALAAPAQEVHLVNAVGYRPVYVRELERALVDQSAQLGQAWGTPAVRFGPSGWRLTVYAGMSPEPTVFAGLHGVDAGVPFASVWPDTLSVNLRPMAISHELIEMLVDPYADRYVNGRLVEVCDPVNGSTYLVNWLPLADFVTPAWFTSGAPGPFDHMGTLRMPLTLAPGVVLDVPTGDSASRAGRPPVR